MDQDRLKLLTTQEMKALRLSAEGKAAGVVATEMNLSTRTVYAHLSSAAKKLGFQTGGEAALQFARFESLGAFAKPDKHVVSLPGWLLRGVDLALPELTGRTTNDLSTGHRLFVIASRVILLALACLMVAMLVREVGVAFRRLS